MHIKDFRKGSFIPVNVLDKFQLGFRAGHSTESALLRVVNDLRIISDSGNSTALILLDFSAAFDTIDHVRAAQLIEFLIAITIMDATIT